MSAVTVVTSNVVNVSVTSSATDFSLLKRFQKELTVAELKNRLELLTGATTSSMRIQIYDKQDRLVIELDNDDALLGSYPIDDGMRMHVIDGSNNVKSFIDSSSDVPKFELDEESYAKRSDNLRSFLVKNKLGKYDDTKAKEQELQLAEEENLAKQITVGSRCEIKLPNQPVKRGEVKYVGPAHFKPGWWIGVNYDEPLGKNDGSIEGKRYFECKPKYGAFVKPSCITIGDYPEEEINLDDEDEM